MLTLAALGKAMAQHACQQTRVSGIAVRQSVADAMETLIVIAKMVNHPVGGVDHLAEVLRGSARIHARDERVRERHCGVRARVRRA